MKKTILALSLFVMFVGLLCADDLIIKSNQVVAEDINVELGNVKIGSGAKLHGNIFIEEGDLFIAPKVGMKGEIKLNKGTVNIDSGVELHGNIFIEEGDLFIAPFVTVNGKLELKKGNIFIKDNVVINFDIVCTSGKVVIGSNCELRGSVTALDLVKGKGSKVVGGFKAIEK